MEIDGRSDKINFIELHGMFKINDNTLAQTRLHTSYTMHHCTIKNLDIFQIRELFRYVFQVIDTLSIYHRVTLRVIIYILILLSIGDLWTPYDNR